MTYLLTEAIYRYFWEILVEDIQMSDFLLEYDETTNTTGVKYAKRHSVVKKDFKLFFNMPPKWNKK